MNLDGFDAWMQAAGHSTGTRNIRRNYIKRFMATVADPVTCTMSDCATFLARDDWSAATKASARSSLAIFFEWMQLEGLRPDSPIKGMKPVKVKTGVPHPCPEEAFAKALKTADQRSLLALMLAGYAGLRRAEIASLHSSNIGETQLRVTGKGDRTRVVPIHPALDPMLDPYRGKDVYLFPSSHGGHLTPTHVGRMVTKYLPDGFSTHSLRHRFASQVHANSKDLRAVQTLLGHSSLATTQVYVSVTDDALTSAVASLREVG